MGAITKIAWCDSTWNPIRGCTRISPGCDHCYAEAMSHRNPAALGEWGAEGRRSVGVESYWNQALRWEREAADAGVIRRVFVPSLGDFFEGEHQDGRELRLGPRPDYLPLLARYRAIAARTPHLRYLNLTKRPWNMLIYAREYGWPSNWWAGCTVEDQERADTRIPFLVDVPAPVLFLSMEPLLERVNLRAVGTGGVRLDALSGCFYRVTVGERQCRAVDWLIVGGESGPGARPFGVEWARELVGEAKYSGVACFVKQLGADPRISGGRRMVLRHPKGGDPDEWPPDLRVRAFPAERPA